MVRGTGNGETRRRQREEIKVRVLTAAAALSGLTLEREIMSGDHLSENSDTVSGVSFVPYGYGEQERGLGLAKAVAMEEMDDTLDESQESISCCQWFLTCWGSCNMVMTVLALAIGILQSCTGTKCCHKSVPGGKKVSKLPTCCWGPEWKGSCREKSTSCCQILTSPFYEYLTRSTAPLPTGFCCCRHGRGIHLLSPQRSIGVLGENVLENTSFRDEKGEIIVDEVNRQWTHLPKTNSSNIIGHEWNQFTRSFRIQEWLEKPAWNSVHRKALKEMEKHKIKRTEMDDKGEGVALLLIQTLVAGKNPYAAFVEHLCYNEKDSFWWLMTGGKEKEAIMSKDYDAEKVKVGMDKWYNEKYPGDTDLRALYKSKFEKGEIICKK